MGNADELARDLTDRVPGHALIEKLLSDWDAGRIRVDHTTGKVVIDEESRGWYWGVIGERRVAGILESIPEATVLHSVPIGSHGADVDHLVITTGGVFTINTKYHSGATVWAAGHGLLVNSTSRAAYLRRSVREANRVRDILSNRAKFPVPVAPVIAFVDAVRFDRKTPNAVDGTVVHVLQADELPGIRTSPRLLSDEQVTRIIQAAVDPWTWQAAHKPARIGAHIAGEFDALRAAVGGALERPAVHAASARMPAPRERSQRPSARTGSSRPASRRKRRGPSILERLIGAAIVAVALLLIMPLMSSILTNMLTNMANR